MSVFITLETPIGDFSIEEADGKIVRSFWDFEGILPQSKTPLLLKAQRQVEDYFSGKLKRFSLPYKISETPFRTQVLENCLKIPYGKKVSYQDLAFHAPRAVGSTMHDNPLPLFIPCHRVLPKNGGLGCYMGKEGVYKKKFLLELEEKNA